MDLSLFAIYDHSAVAFRHRILADDLTYAIYTDSTRFRIFNGIHMSDHRCIHIGIFKGKIASLHCAINKLQIFAVAKRLCANDLASNEGDILRKPSEIFALDNALLHRHVFRVPEGILRIKNAILDMQIFYVLERIFSLQFKVFKRNIAAIKENVFCRDLRITHRHIRAFPPKFGRDRFAPLHANMLTFTKDLNAVASAIFEGTMLSIPDSGSCALIKG